MAKMLLIPYDNTIPFSIVDVPADGYGLEENMTKHVEGFPEIYQTNETGFLVWQHTDPVSMGCPLNERATRLVTAIDPPQPGEDPVRGMYGNVMISGPKIGHESYADVPVNVTATVREQQISQRTKDRLGGN